MTRSIFAGAVLLVVCSLVDLSSQTPTPANEARDADEIVRLLCEWGDAMARRDAQALSRLLADDFTFVSPRGRLMRKAAYVANRDAANRDSLGAFAAESSQPIGYPGAHAASDSALRGINGDQLIWSDSPVFPGARFALLYGMPYTGGYAIRMRGPNGHVEQTHRHESDEHLSVISGIVHVGVGDELNRASARTFREGGYVVISAGTVHYSWGEGEVLENVYWSGAAAAVYTKPAGRR